MTKDKLEECLNKVSEENSALKLKIESLQMKTTLIEQERTRLWSLVNELTTAIRHGSAEGRFPRQ